MPDHRVPDETCNFPAALQAGLVPCGIAGRVLLAVSGGADSVALLRGMVELRSEIGLDAVVAHLDHGLSEDSASVAEWVRELAAEHGLNAICERRDVGAIASDRGLGLEETARAERYRFLGDAARQADTRTVILAHTADDQAETILHHVLRGTGLNGLRGMPRERAFDGPVRLVRPMLAISRTEVVGYLAALGQAYREDPSNADRRFTRNRIRHELLPRLEEDFNPRVRAALLRLAAQAADAIGVVDTLAANRLDAALLAETGESVTLDAERLAADPHDHVLRAAFVELWRRRGWPRQRMGFDDWQRLVTVTRDGGAISLPGGISGRRRGNTLIVAVRTGPGVENHGERG